MIKLIATDIDGTLLKDGTLMIDPEYMTVIEKLTSKGIIFVACSGRQFISERKLFAPVCDKLLYITDGGTVVRTPHKILKVHTLPEDVWHGMCETVRNELPDCDYFIATPDYCLAEDAGSRMFRWLTDSYGYDIREVPDLLKAPVDLSLIHISIIAWLKSPGLSFGITSHKSFSTAFFTSSSEIHRSSLRMRAITRSTFPSTAGFVFP